MTHVYAAYTETAKMSDVFSYKVCSSFLIILAYDLVKVTLAGNSDTSDKVETF